MSHKDPPRKRGRPRTPWKQYGLRLHPGHVEFLDRVARELGMDRSAAMRFVLDHAMQEMGVKVGE